VSLSCPNCGYCLTDPAPAAVDPVDQLRAWCAERGHWVMEDGRVFEDVAAQILGLSAGTLRNRRSYGSGALPYHRSGGGRITYRLADLIAYRDAGDVE
jgi:hypothetical protein